MQHPSHVAEPKHFDPTQPPKKPAAASHASVPWGPKTAVLYALAVYFVTQFVATLPLVIYVHMRGLHGSDAQAWIDNSVVAQFCYIAFVEALAFGAIWWFIRRRKSGLRDIGWQGIRWWDPVMMFAGFAAYFVLYSVVLGAATRLFPGINVDQKQQLGFQNATGTDNLTLTFLSLVVLPPLVEETIFRGFIFTSLRGKMKWGWAALITSVLFATAHLEFGSGAPLLWVAAIDTFCLSLVLCYLRQQSDSLWPGILLHGLKNGIAFVSLFIIHVH